MYMRIQIFIFGMMEMKIISIEFYLYHLKIVIIIQNPEIIISIIQNHPILYLEDLVRNIHLDIV